MFLGSKGLNQHCVLGAPGTVLLEETFTAETKPWARQAAAVSFAPGASRPAVQGPQNSPDQHPVGGAFSGGLNTRRGQAGLAASREAGAALGRRPLLRGGGRGGPGTQTRIVCSQCSLPRKCHAQPYSSFKAGVRPKVRSHCSPKVADQNWKA